VGISLSTDMTMINGRIVWENGAFVGLDEAKLAADAEAALATVEF
jgi:hydroxyatrazine ethylaminohydrolase